MTHFFETLPDLHPVLYWMWIIMLTLAVGTTGYIICLAAGKLLSYLSYYEENEEGGNDVR